MHILKFFAKCFLLFCLAIAPAGVEAKSLPKVRVQLPWFLSVEWAGIVMAKEKKFDLKYGVELEIVNYKSGLDPVKNVMTGNVDIGIIDAASLIINRSKGQDVVAIWAQMQISPVGICTLKGTGIKKINDIVGKRFGIQPEYEYLLDIFLANANISKSAVNMVHIEGYPVIPIEQGQIDAAGCFDIYQAPLLRIRGQEPVVLRSSDLGFNFYEQVLFITGETLKNNSEVIQRAVNSINDGWLYALEHTDKTVSVMTTKYRPFDPSEWLVKSQKDYVKHQKASLRLIRFYMMNGVGTRIGMMRQRRWEHSIDVLYKNDLIQQAIAPEKVFTLNFIRQLPKKIGGI